MPNIEKHLEKYTMFKKDAENRSISYPTRIESYFSSAFHIIEACMAKKDLHINKHQKVRESLESHREIFGEEGDKIWREFQRIENQIRPGQIYGGRVNGEELEKAEKSFQEIESRCQKFLKV
jgi:hypothetical protein